MLIEGRVVNIQLLIPELRKYFLEYLKDFRIKEEIKRILRSKGVNVQNIKIKVEFEGEEEDIIPFKAYIENLPKEIEQKIKFPYLSFELEEENDFPFLSKN